MKNIEHNESPDTEHESNTAWNELGAVPFAGEGKESLHEGRFDSQRLPLSKNPEIRNSQEKFLRGEPLSVFDKIHDRDGASIVTRIGDYELKTLG